MSPPAIDLARPSGRYAGWPAPDGLPKTSPGRDDSRLRHPHETQLSRRAETCNQAVTPAPGGPQNAPIGLIPARTGRRHRPPYDPPEAAPAGIACERQLFGAAPSRQVQASGGRSSSTFRHLAGLRESPDQVILWAKPQRCAWWPAIWGTVPVHSTTSVTTAGVRERLPPEGAAHPRLDQAMWGAGPQSPHGGRPRTTSLAGRGHPREAIVHWAIELAARAT